QLMIKILTLFGLLIVVSFLTGCERTFYYKKNITGRFYLVEDESASGKSLCIKHGKDSWQHLITGDIVYVLANKTKILIQQKRTAPSWSYYYLIDVSTTEYEEDILKITETEFYIIK